MIVRKFGGTSLATALAMHRIQDIVGHDSPQIIVLSAISGITNQLEDISDLLHKGKKVEARKMIESMHDFYKNYLHQLELNQENFEAAENFLHERKMYLLGFTNRMYHSLDKKAILADGEMVSTTLYYLMAKEKEPNIILLNALDFMRIDKDLEPDIFYINQNLNRIIGSYPKDQIYITQGYICRNAFGEVDNLQRGGSDFSATLMGSAVGAERIEIWTDIDGVHNNDPRYVENTQSIEKMSFPEAAELAYFGAKILHPAALLPAIRSGISVILKNTFSPKSKGTALHQEAAGEGIKAIAAKEGISVIRIRSARMLNAYGFLRKVFEVFEIYKTPIDMITTSEVAVSLTIDDQKFLDDIVKDLSHFCSVEVEQNQCIVAVVGVMKQNKKGYAASVFDTLINVPVKMISYGASDYNISLLIDSKDKQRALNALHVLVNSKA